MKRIEFAWPEGRAGAFTSSWDDGTVHDRRLAKILREAGLPATFNLNGSRVEKALDKGQGDLGAAELATELAGHEVACHGFTHPFLDRLPAEKMLGEITEDRRLLEAALKRPVKGFALPYGTYDDRVLAVLRSAGLLYSRTVKSHERFHLPADFLEWHPTCHHKADLDRLLAAFLADRNPQKLFYLWGHSYEFDRDGNWDLLETLAAALKPKVEAGEIWAATNIDVYRYVTAFRTLWCSLDGASFFNPAALPLWLKADGLLLRIGAGEGLALG